MSRIRLILLLVPAVLLGIVAALLGLHPVFAFAWVLLLAAIILLAGTVRTEPPPAWPPGLPEDRVAASSVARLAWAIDLRRDRVATPAVLRVRAVLARRLRRAGIDWDDPAQRGEVARLLGGEALVTRLYDGTVTVRELRHLLEVAERIGPKEDT